MTPRKSNAPPTSQRGFGLIVYALLAVAGLAMISALAYRTYQAGADSVKIQWAEANRMAEAEATRIQLEREAEARKAVAAQQLAERKARDYETKWRNARNTLRNVPLAVSDCSRTPTINAAGPVAIQPSTPPSEAPSGAGGLGLRLTYSFIGLWDSAWSGAGGEPLWPNPGESAERPLAAGSPVTLEGVLENHATNASRCSENSRQLAALIALIRRLRVD